MIKLLDRYIIKKFLSTFFVSIVLMIMLIIVIDLTDKLGRFIDDKIPAKEIIFHYYMSLVPFYLNLFMPLFIFLSIIFFTSKLASHSEVIAILSSGASFMRFSKPYFLTAAILAIFSFILGNFIIPPANKNRVEFETNYINYGVERELRNIHKQISPGVFIYIKYYDKTNNIGHNFAMETFENAKLITKISADNIVWDSISNSWRVTSYVYRKIGNQKDVFEKGISKTFDLKLKPKDIVENVVDITTLNLFALGKFIKELKMHGNKNLNTFKLEMQKRFSLPFSTFILSFIGLSLSSKKSRGGTGLSLGIGISLSLIYILMSRLSDQWAISGLMTPFISVWLTNVIFILISVYLYKFAPK